MSKIYVIFVSIEVDAGWVKRWLSLLSMLLHQPLPVYLHWFPSSSGKTVLNYFYCSLTQFNLHSHKSRLCHFLALFIQEIWGKVHTVIPFQRPMSETEQNKFNHIFQFFPLIISLPFCNLCQFSERNI